MQPQDRRMPMRRALAALALACLASVSAAQEPVALPAPDADGWITLFNGKDLTGWAGDPAVWKVVDGYISGKAEKVGGNTFLIYNHVFSDFVVEAKWILVKEGKFPNSGLQYRSNVRDWKKWVVHGYQADIGDGYHGALYEEGGKRGLVIKPNPEAVKTVKADDWNQYQITAEGSKVKHVLNGVAVGEFDDQDEKARRTEGILALQYHSPGGFEIKWKDIRIKPLKK
jgi:hypothetical protein